MKKTKNCGFTLIELVIVIAVIAILSTVLIPTFGGMIESARNSSRDQKARNAYTDYFAHHPTDDNSYLMIEVEDGGAKYHYNVIDGQIDLEGESKALFIMHENGIKGNGYVIYPNTSVNQLWINKWNEMVILKTRPVKTALINIYTPPLSTPRLSRRLDYYKIVELVDILDDMSFKKAENCATDYFGIPEYEYSIELINDDTLIEDEETLFAYSVRFLVNSEGFVFIGVGQIAEQVWYISNKSIDVNKIEKFYNTSDSSDS